jgi:hypothetical protein
VTIATIYKNRKIYRKMKEVHIAYDCEDWWFLRIFGMTDNKATIMKISNDTNILTCTSSRLINCGKNTQAILCSDRLACCLILIATFFLQICGSAFLLIASSYNLNKCVPCCYPLDEVILIVALLTLFCWTTCNTNIGSAPTFSVLVDHIA